MVTSCISKTRAEQVKAGTRHNPAVTQEDTTRNSPASVVRAFLKWYRDNEERIHRTSLVKGGLEDTTTFYSVDFKATEEYISELRKSGCLSEKYLGNLKQYIVSTHDSLLKYPQNDGPPPGFEADLVMQAQDYMDIMERVDSLPIYPEHITGNRATVVLNRFPGHKVVFTLSQYNDAWLIDAFTYTHK